MLPKFVLGEVLSYLNLKEFCSFQSGIKNKDIHQKINNLIGGNKNLENLFVLLKNENTLHVKDLARCTKTIPLFQLVSSYTFVNSEDLLVKQLDLFVHEKLNSLDSPIKYNIYFPGVGMTKEGCEINLTTQWEGKIRLEKKVTEKPSPLNECQEEDFHAKISIVFLGKTEATQKGYSKTGSSYPNLSKEEKCKDYLAIHIWKDNLHKPPHLKSQIINTTQPGVVELVEQPFITSTISESVGNSVRSRAENLIKSQFSIGDTEKNPTEN